ncbi:hypothetical protein GKZ89_07645 [Bacillus mangrovi]|uniref:ABC transporter permease n=1 Tax=Metabacillus mangrovi TaxID=1491830 RepID=A0A7X2S4D1_9BACI|nr:ABC-2 transporter permease [Metabacillus mangrovi]MTH53285.1 hypothetical protein [Metabacillus mangrovi]
MYNLILKDFRLQKWLFLIYLAIVVLYIGVGSNLPVITAVVGGSYAINTHWYDSKKNGNIFLISLPYSRGKIILSKFIGTFIVSVIYAFITLGLQAAITGGKETGSIGDILFGLMSVMIFTALYFPLLYKFSNRYLVTILSFLFILFIFFGMKVMDLAGEMVMSFFETVVSLSPADLLAWTGAVTVVLCVMSYFLTLKIYKAREF